MVDAGEPAPQFELTNQHGEPISLTGLTGQWVVLWFFPRVDTDALPYTDPWARERSQRGELPRCTRQACSFRDTWGAFQDRNVAVLGVSTDPVPDQRAFAIDFDLPFDLLSDPNGTVADMYSSFGPRMIEGREYDIASRDTFIIDDEGTIAHTYREVSNVEEHAQDVLNKIDAQKRSPPF